MKKLFYLLTLITLMQSCERSNKLSIKEVKQINPERIIVIDDMKCTEIFDSLIHVYLIQQPENGYNAILSKVERINLYRVNKRMKQLVFNLRMKCEENCKNSPEYYNAEYRRRFDKYLAQSITSFSQNYEAMGYLHTPDLFAFSGSSTYRKKMSLKYNL